jgi:hypothetical protein
MSNESRRLANLRRLSARRHAIVTNPIIDENDPTAILDSLFADTVEMHEALQPQKRGRKSPKIKRVRSTPALRNRAEGTLWIKAEEKRRNRGQRLPRNRDKRLALLKPIVDEANRMLSEIGEPFRRFTAEEFLPLQPLGR